jgi:hypothetical protein
MTLAPVVAQSRPMILVKDSSGTTLGLVQPAPKPPLDPLASKFGFTQILSKKDVKDKNGRIITGFAFTGWMEESNVRISIYALLPLESAGNVYVEEGQLAMLRRSEFVTFVLSVGASRVVDEMKALGIDPVRIQLDPDPRAPK